MSAECWRPVVGAEDFYEVSSQGRVRSLDRTVTSGVATYRIPGRLLRQRPGGRCNNYRRVMLNLPVQRHAYVHHLLLAAFVGPRPADMLACHRDDVGHHNAVDNLYWGTPAQNRRDFQANHAAVGQAGMHTASDSPPDAGDAGLTPAGCTSADDDGVPF